MTYTDVWLSCISCCNLQHAERFRACVSGWHAEVKKAENENGKLGSGSVQVFKIVP